MIIAERFEPTADLLVAQLRQREVACVRWNLDRFPVGSELTYRASNDEFDAVVISDERIVDLATVASVWCRHLEASGWSSDINDDERQFVETQTRRVLAALVSVCDCVWINHPHHHLRANSKPAQLFMARELGLEIPRTVITNDPDEVRAFRDRIDGEMIFKALSQNLNAGPGMALYTGVVTDSELANLDLIRASPGIFQERIVKAYEVRATVVGSNIFAARINSQAHEKTRLDWRHQPYEVDDEPIELPVELASTIGRFMQAFGLIYGAFDFVVTPEGRYVFLEVNPAGQYMWVENRTGLGITAALVDALAAPCLA